MHRLLKYLPARWHIYVLDWFWFLPIGLLCLGCFALIIYFATPAPYQNAGYVTAQVQTGMDVSTENGFRYRFVGALDDGTLVTFGTRSMALAATAAQTACLQRRAHDDGTISYVLAYPERCQAPP